MDFAQPLEPVGCSIVSSITIIPQMYCEFVLQSNVDIILLT